jgi:fatty acid desaturase
MTVKQPSYKPPFLDWITTGVILLMVGGFAALVWGQHAGYVPFWASIILGTLLMNLSFTAWHEPAHRNFSRVRVLNDIAGIIASAGSVYPGYYARRWEHLVHHRFEGIPGKDPVYYRIQTNFWRFPLDVFLVNYGPNKRTLDIPDSFHPIKPWMKVADALSNLFALGLIALSVLFDFWFALVCAWIIPRVIVFIIHAYYICFFPHHIDEGGYKVYRVRDRGWLLRFLTVEQNFHGLHHKWPYIPWYKYRKVFKDYSESMDEMDVEVLH